MEQQSLLFDQRFMPRYVGSIITDPATAIVELVANAWDAYATEVHITWPDRSAERQFAIRDNGKGMTSAQFEHRWGTLDYNRLQSQGELSRPPGDLAGLPPRHAYGRNGRGRHAAFHFSDPYELITWRDGVRLTYRVRLGTGVPFEWDLIETRDGVPGHGSEIRATSVESVNLSPDQVREVLGSRFLVDPSFRVFVDGTAVTFDDIPADLLRESEVEVEGLGVARVLMIDTKKADKTTRQHGIAWRVMQRLVGDAGWKGTDYERVIDGRRSEAKRFTFIVFADFLANSVKPDWSGFEPNDAAWTKARPLVQDRIREMMGAFNAEARDEAREVVRSRHHATVRQLPPVSVDRWNAFVDKVIDTCPSISVEEVNQVAGILANLERASSKYGLITKLNELPTGDLDELHSLLGDWTVRTAKLALDEIQTRLRLIAELDVKLRDENADEVQDLQPLFERGLWVFGPQFESIEYTSNKGMTEVIRKICKVPERGSLQRPDFVIVPDGSIGLYSRDGFGRDAEVNGIASLVVVEIKKPGVTIGMEQKDQAWKYVKELLGKSLIDARTDVRCFVLGSKVDPTENAPRKEFNDRVVIEPMSYDVFVRRAERRMLNLRSRLADAPFLLAEGVDAMAFVAEPALGRQSELLAEPAE